MNIAIVTKMVNEVKIIHSVLQKERCECFIISDVCLLEKVSRNSVLDFLLVDENFLCNSNNTTILKKSLGIVNKNVPIFYFHIYSFNPYCISNAHDNDLDKLNTILKLLDTVKNEMLVFQRTHDILFRPAEKKLYSLLKSSTQEAISLEEMAVYLWGQSNQAHKKTLYTYMHRIKQILRENNQDLEWLVKQKKGCYKISNIKKEIFETKVATFK